MKGICSRHERSTENGQYLIEFSVEYILRIMSTYFKQGTRVSEKSGAAYQTKERLESSRILKICEDIRRRFSKSKGEDIPNNGQTYSLHQHMNVRL